jgi:hypothetical protein
MNVSVLEGACKQVKHACIWLSVSTGGAKQHSLLRHQLTAEHASLHAGYT